MKKKKAAPPTGTTHYKDTENHLLMYVSVIVFLVVNLLFILL